MSAVLRLEAVDKSYPTPSGQVDVLRRVNLQLEEGEFAVVTGPSGSGKTTLLSIAGLLDGPTSGSVWFDGHGVPPNDEPVLRRLRRESIGMVFQRFHLFERRSVLDNVLFRYRYLRHDPRTAREQAERALEQLGLSELRDRPARVLSAGERQRVAIARAVTLPPRLLLADEPTGNLDPESTARVMGCFRSLHARGMTVLLVTHHEALRAGSDRHLRCSGRTVVEAA